MSGGNFGLFNKEQLMSIQPRTRFAGWCVSLIVMLTLGPSLAWAETLVVPFELHVGGDDDFEQRFFDTPFPDEGPTLLTLDGFVENLDTVATGHVVKLFWYATDGSLQRAHIEFDTPGADPMSGPIQIPFHLEQSLDFTSPMVGFEVEGLGPGDSLDFTGIFTYSQVPEPAGAALAAIALIGLFGFARRRRVAIR